jgi:GT2 family glycosyltransferase
VSGYPLADVDYVPGTIFLARRGAFEQIGDLDVDFFFSGEIADFCKRARNSGYRVCIDLQAQARHDTRMVPQSLRDTLYVYYNLRNRFLYAKKHYPSEQAKYLARWSGLCLVEGGRALAAGKLRKARAILLALAHGCTGRFGNRNAVFL